MNNLFSLRTLEKMTESLARYLPPGRLFASKFNRQKDLYLFLRGLAGELQRANNLLREYNIQYYPDETTDFLDEWEQALGLPDDCFTLSTEPPLVQPDNSIVSRRRNILIKLAGMNLQTAQDFINTAALLGMVVTVVGGLDPSVIPPITPIKRARFTIVVTFVSLTSFPLTFPILFGSTHFPILTCIFLKGKPANCDLIFNTV
jgi:hypothetical protein